MVRLERHALEEVLRDREVEVERRSDAILAALVNWAHQSRPSINPESPEWIELVMAAISALDSKLSEAGKDLKQAVESAGDIAHRVQSLEEWRTGITNWVRGLTLTLLAYLIEQFISGRLVISVPPKP